MKKSIIIFSAICLMLIAYIIGVKAIHNAYLVSDDGDTYVIGYGYNNDDELDDEYHEYIREEE